MKKYYLKETERAGMSNFLKRKREKQSMQIDKKGKEL